MQSIKNVKHLIQRHLKTFEKERNCNRNRSTLQKCIKIQFFDLIHTNLLVIGNRGSENRRNILEIKITMLKRVKKFCDPRWSCNLSNTTIRCHCAPCVRHCFQRTSPQSLSDRRKIVGDKGCGLGCGTRFPATNWIYWSV